MIGIIIFVISNGAAANTKSINLENIFINTYECRRI